MSVIATLIVVALSAWYLLWNFRQFRTGEISRFGLVVAIVITVILLVFGECAVMMIGSISSPHLAPPQ